MKYSEVQGNAEQFASTVFDRIFFLPLCSFKPVLWGLFRPHKACKKALHWNPWPRALFLLCTDYTTKLQKHFSFVWVCVTSVSIGSIYYSMWHKEWWGFRTHGYTPAQLKTKDYGATLRKVYENQVTGGKTENSVLRNTELVQ